MYPNPQRYADGSTKHPIVHLLGLHVHLHGGVGFGSMENGVEVNGKRYWKVQNKRLPGGAKATLDPV